MNTLHRFPHGATRGPGLTRPLSGYGRPAGRPGPPVPLATRQETSRRLVHRLFMRRVVEPEPNLPDGWSLSS